MTEELTNGKFNDFIKQGVALVDFYADWCMPCIMMAPVIDELNAKFRGKIKFGKVNVDDNRELAEKFDVASIPNFVVFKNGKMIERFIGSMGEDEFEKRLRKLL